MDIFISTPLRRTASAVACTIFFSSACLLGAVGPAMASSLPTSADARALSQSSDTQLNDGRVTREAPGSHARLVETAALPRG